MSRRHSASTPPKAPAPSNVDDAAPRIIVPKIGLPETGPTSPEAGETEAVAAGAASEETTGAEIPQHETAAAPDADAAADPDYPDYPDYPGYPDYPAVASGTGGRTVPVLGLYLLVVLLLALLESGRLQTFLEQTELPGAVQAAALVQDAARLSGATLVSSAETRLARQLTVETVIGSTTSAGRSLAAAAAGIPATAVPAFVPPSGRPVLPAGTPGTPQISQTPQISTTSETPTPPQAPTSTRQPRQAAVPKLLIVGDSLIMEGLGPSLHRTLRKRADISVVREGRYSTGLTRTDTFNWPDRMRELVALHQPDIILVCLGANDSQDILVDGKRHIAGTPSWQTLYRARADRFVAEATAEGARVIWLGLPVMGKPAYEKRIRLLSDLQQAACEAEPLCRFQNGIPPLADAEGNYLAFVLDDKGQHVRLRYKDMVHVTEQGGQRLVDSAMPLIDRFIEEVKNGVVPDGSTPAVPSATPVPPATPATPATPEISATP